MVENSEGLKINNTLEDLIEEGNKKIYNGELTEIIEVTYAYEVLGNGNFWNITLFTKFLGEDCKDVIKLSQIGKDLKDKLNKKIEEVDKFIEKVKLLVIVSEEVKIKKEFLESSLLNVRNALEMAIIGVPFELEKAGLELKIDEEEIKIRVDKLEELEKENFGGNIRDNPEEVALCYDYLYSRYIKYKDKLTPEEIEKIQEYEKYLSKIKDLIPDHKYKEKDKSVESDDSLEEIKNRKLPREKYMQVLEIALDILRLDVPVKEGNVSSIYDGESALVIPTDENYDYLSVGRLTELIQHEIESHYNNSFTNKDIIGNFRSSGSVEKEEGVAMLFEAMLNGEKISNIGIPQHFPKVLASELFAGDDLKRFLELNNKVSPDIGSNGRFLRLKRNYPMNYKGGQHKDSSYGRGIIKVVKYIQDGNNVVGLFSGKVPVEYIPKVMRLLELQGKDAYNKVRMPLFLGELVRFILKEQKEFKGAGMKLRFIKFLKKKYPFVTFDIKNIPIFQSGVKCKIKRILEIFNEASNEYT